MFVQADRVAVQDDAGNTIYIRRKMDVGAISRVQGAPAEERLIALYVANIVAWEGPAFQGIPCTPEQIARLDPQEPLVEAVGTKIAELNKRPESPLPNSATSDGSTNGGSPSIAASTNGAASPTPSLSGTSI